MELMGCTGVVSIHHQNGHGGALLVVLVGQQDAA
tara:strand:- start:51 stop:152 length:102 start_codon:yes stop_codon:yes gene_type:complete